MSTLNKWMKKVANLFKEKPQVKVDDYELEHLLIYHSLVGTSPENQRSFKDVKGDIELALGNESSAQMAIALRLPPLWWDEKLKAILSELGEREKFITCLAPDVPDDSFDMSAIPLLHEDWRVRANTAILLGFLQAENVEAKLIQSLHDTATGARTAFPHQAYALAKFRSAQTQAALEKYLMDDDSWMRVDAAGALALMNEGKLSETQLKSILEKHSLSDYGAVVIARNLDLPAIMASSNRLESTAGARLIDGILESSSGTFPAETVTETRTSECLPQLFKLVRDDKCITAANASFTLAQWLDANHS
ncbi:MAG: HEAT repeat domain-containing protein, partial [Cyanobacteria bacterium]|nr:HEAT repeat domain-containing protein [Cyanobacteriota bacterium]